MLRSSAAAFFAGSGACPGAGAAWGPVVEPDIGVTLRVERTTPSEDRLLARVLAVRPFTVLPATAWVAAGPVNDSCDFAPGQVTAPEARRPAIWSSS